MTNDIERKIKYGNDTLKLSTYNTITGKTLTNVADLPNIGDIMWYISDIFTMGVQYGHRTELCDFLMNGTWYNNETMEFNYANFTSYAASKAKIDEYDAKMLANSVVSNTNIIRQWTW